MSKRKVKIEMNDAENWFYIIDDEGLWYVHSLPKGEVRLSISISGGGATTHFPLDCLEIVDNRVEKGEKKDEGK